ncbi:MAG TPA: alpha/beta fold hydrolase [Usitatibacter sp.]|nr:alpha/beta fold hydrolase [Usitatibacter sp.]
MKIAFLGIVLLAASTHVPAGVVPSPDTLGGLRRAASLGVALDPSADRPTIAAVGPGSAAERMGLRAQDLIQSVDRKEIDGTASLLAALRAKRAGDALSLVARRGGETLTLAGTLAAPPLENQAEYDIEYRSFAIDGARRRAIVTRPRMGGKRPAVLLIGGIGCYSLDGLLRPSELREPYAKLLDSLTRAGYVTMRVEKSGMGDSEGVPCADPKADFDAEVRGFRAGLEHLEGMDAVDRRHVFIFAHSIGPLVAARIAAEHRVRGIAMAETIGTSWIEYELTNVRRQYLLGGMPYDEVDRRARHHQQCAHRLYVEKKRPEEIIAADKACAPELQAPAPYTYMQQLGSLDLASLWKRIDAPALIFYGTADFVTDSYQHEYLRDMINSFRPGHARYVVVDGMDHGLTLAGTQKASLAGVPDAPVAQQVLDETLRFFNERVAS